MIHQGFRFGDCSMAFLYVSPFTKKQKKSAPHFGVVWTHLEAAMLRLAIAVWLAKGGPVGEGGR